MRIKVVNLVSYQSSHNLPEKSFAPFNKCCSNMYKCFAEVSALVPRRCIC